ncbi:MAG: hypothetical protein OSB41_12950, partial [Kiritimatiellae bacterium]|nr:hypothetical protein [Kiritimatiellia bacterium]
MHILFISNAASNTGAPIGLLHLMRWLKENTNVTFELLLRVSGGTLQPVFESLCNVVAYDELWSGQRLPARVARRFGFNSLLGQSCLSPVEQRYGTSGFD